MAENTIQSKMLDDAGVSNALRLGVQSALERHRRLGEKIAVWRDGKPVIMSVEEAMATAPEAKTAT